MPVAALARRYGAAPVVAAVAVACAVEVAWAWSKTPELFTGEPAARVEGRSAAARWLAATGRPNDVLLGYDPVFAAAWEDGAGSRLVVPRADARLALARAARGGRAARPRRLGLRRLGHEQRRRGGSGRAAPAVAGRGLRGAHVRALPRRAHARPTGSAAGLPHGSAAAAQVVGKSLGLGDADINFATMSRAAALAGYAPSRPASRSTSSR